MSSDPSQSATAPTVVVARRVRPGHEDEFREWDRRIRDAAESYPGSLGSEVQPPNPSHPGEWVTVYSFATAEQLDAWLQSEQRRAFMVEVDGIIDGEAREQRIAGMRMAPEPVTIVSSQCIAPHNRDEFVALHRDAVDRLQGFPGFLGSELLPPVEGVQEEHVIVASFASRPDLDRWLESDTRHEWLDRVEKLVEGDRTYNVVGGFGGWFPAQPSQPQGPKRWKQSIAVFIALFPTVLIITLIRGAIAPNMNVVLAVFIGNVLGILALTYVLMPPLTHRLRHWLSR
ncbi:MAG: antibiotic biosynthesis monooxygenase [Actinomycetota bacterium]|nr:antibiotic biosynthesis monooxygenase [Actinomycetota bacterium]